MTLVVARRIWPSRNDDEVDQTLQNFVCKMFLVGRAVCFLLALVVTVIAVITNSQNNTRRVPPPKPFFARQTWVEDFYEGELYYALLKATKYDVIFLMLYAPWDADSQKARSEFETACRYFHKKIYCAAVNCWQANSRCRAVFDNIAMYPMFLVDLYNVPSIKYNGEFVASHMIRFLSTVMKPLERISSVEKFHSLSAMCDNLVVSFLPDYKWYRRYYSASLRHLEYDPERDNCWSVITDPILAETLDVQPFTVQLQTWNETKIYDHPYVDKFIAKWVNDNSNFLTRWLSFKNSKSTALSELLEHNPAVILFTPRNMLLRHIPSYLVFKEAALEFKSCFHQGEMRTKGPSSAEQWERIIEEHQLWEHICKSRFSMKNTSYNSTIFDLTRQNYEKYVFTSTHAGNETQWDCLSDTSDTSRKSTLGAKVITSMLDSSKDDRSPQNLVVLYVRERCRQQILLKNTFDYSYLANTPPPAPGARIPSALCRLNDTFSFFAVDSLLYSHFATALGINLNEYKDQTTAVIFDNRNEETYVLDKTFISSDILHEFLVNFSGHAIPRWMKSTENASLYLNRYNRLNDPIRDEIAVLELNSRTFESVIFDSSQYVVVYFYSPYCSYCQVSAYTFLSVAHKLRNIAQVTFARIDGENNDLPWHLVPLSYPTIMIFPAKTKSESVTFPQSLELTVENLFEFVVSNVDVEIRLAAMLDECSQYKNNRQNCDLFDECITRVKAHCLSSINKLVDRYVNTAVNLTVAHHNLTLSRLKFFKTFYLSVENL